MVSIATLFPKLKTGRTLSSKPSNIKTVDWMPQNDILGHVKTKLFLSHLGHNSMYEAAYHGVPIVGFPIWSDQPENARQIARAGMGLWVDINSVTEDELRMSISRVMTEARYVCFSTDKRLQHSHSKTSSSVESNMLNVFGHPVE